MTRPPGTDTVHLSWGDRAAICTLALMILTAACVLYARLAVMESKYDDFNRRLSALETKR